MMSWLRPRRRKVAKPDAGQSSNSGKDQQPPTTSTAGSFFRRPLRRSSTNATLVNDDEAECSSRRSSFFGSNSKRCSSPPPSIFDSPPPSPLSPAKTLLPLDECSTWKEKQPYFSAVHLPSTPTPIDVPRSGLSKVVSATTHAFGAILQASVVVGEASNIPYLKGIAGLILQISNAVQASEENRVELARLTAKILEIHAVVVECPDSGDASERYRSGLASVQQACERIEKALDTWMRRSKGRRFIEAANEWELLRQCDKELQNCLDLLHLRSNISLRTAVARRETADTVFVEAAEDILAPAKAMLKETSVLVEEPEEICEEPLEAFNSDEQLPPPSQFFCVRESELSVLVNLFATKSASSALLGQAGSGKSTLALQLVHHPDIVTRFADRRVWVDCAGVERLEDVFSRLAEALGLACAVRKSVLSALTHDAPTLVVFDNLDDAWDTPIADLKLGVEHLFEDMSAIPSVSVLVTLRGTQRPAYTKAAPGVPPLCGLSITGARQLFLEVSGLDEDCVDTQQLEELLSLVGHHPLAIAALAQQSQFEQIDFLAERWREEGFSMLDDENPVAHVIASALTSPRMRACPAALDVLRVLAGTPEGVPKAQIKALVAASQTNGVGITDAMFSRAVNVLHCTALTTIVDGERVKVPEIVRAYLEAH
ncbi:hypothetical protein HMN09_00489800 [Mycena chlorophos]|uniref:NB-ARC domain-containing protein n=1 Tax=Mycena chlorophos TaxID=658473 RepID=A0A8H6T929_MYCCL|nr:hypothetical protein HMN09_00489800 [Mycena chlorophos]